MCVQPEQKITEFRGEFCWLSSFWPAKVEMDGIVYPTVEHAYQAAKTTDLDEREKVRNCKTPGQAKRVTVSMREDWEDLKLVVMRRLVKQKFQKHPDLRQKLIDTGNMQIQEGNWWGDTFWGVDRDTGEGENHLGRILMDIRHLCKTGEINK